MRTIKFRAWDKKEKTEKMIYLTQEFLKERQGNLQDFLYSPDRFIPIEFTGLKDKNGKEIYESDILSVEDHINMEVLWDLKLGMWITQSHRKLGEMLVNYKCEVIGNIYENDIIKLNKKEGENL